MFPIRPGVGKKLLGLALLNAAAFALVAGIAAVAFTRVEILASDIARNQMSEVLENASIARELSAEFSEIELISRSCRSGSASADLGKRASASLAGIAQKSQDNQLAATITALSATTTELLDQCSSIRGILVSVDSIDRQIMDEMARLENIIGRTLIEQTLSGKATDYLDQIMTLITGFRETMLEIGKNIAEREVVASADPQNGNPNVALIDDLNLRLQTLTASNPEIARIAKRAIRLTVAYRGQVLQLDSAIKRFNDSVTRSHAAKADVLKTMSRLDGQSSSRAVDLGLQIRQAVAAASRWVLGLSLLIAILSFLTITVIVRRSINRPLSKVLQHIDAVRRGAVTPDVGTPGGDEWGTIHSALLDMTSELARSRSLLQAVVDTAPMRIFWKDQNLRYLGCNPAFARDAGKAHPEELLGKDDYQMGWAEQAERYRADDRAVMVSGIARLSFDEPQTTPDGRTTWVRTSKVPLRDSDNRTIGILGVYQDITERRRIERRLALAIEVTRVILWEVDFTDGRLEYDRTLLPVLGLAPDEELNSLQLWVERVHPDDRAPFQEAVARAMQPETGPFDLEYRLQTTMDQYQWIHTRGTVIQRDPQGNAEHAVGTSMNVTERKSIQEAMRQSEERSRRLAALLRLMADNVPDMIWAKDLEKRFLFANRAVCRQLLNATDTDEPVGKTDMFFAQRERDNHADNPQWHTFGELCQDSDAITLQRGEPSVFEEFGNIKGSLTYLDVHKAPFVDERGVVIGTVGSARDITERKQTETELERHRQQLEELVAQRTSQLLATEARATRILDSAADGLYGVDNQGRITFINPAACQMLGYTLEQAMGRSAHDLFRHSRSDGSPCPAAECMICQAWQAGRESRVDDEACWHADGHAVPVTLASRPIVENGKLAGAVVSVVDVSSQRAATRAREQALIAAENLARARSEFLANMSHEIRTPMNGVLGFAQIGQRTYKDPEKARNAFEKILTSGNRLLGIVNDILDFSRIDAGKMHVEAIEMSLGEALDHALELVADRARAKGLELRLEKAPNLPLACISDPLRLGQILLNLLTNAVKFTESGSVTLSAACRDGQLVFRVADTGVGMSADQIGYVFNPFQQADGSITRRFGGTGLGLAICKRLLELMQGDIRVESTPGSGSMFEVRLPYLRPAQHPDIGDATLMTQPDEPLTGLSILLAEDDSINQLMLEAYLEDAGARVVTVGDGATAVEHVIANGPKAYDIVLMDLQMPVMDGYEATRRILELVPGLPIIGQTAHAFDEDRDKCLAAGMAGYIAKPIHPPALATLILQVVATGRGEQAATSGLSATAASRRDSVKRQE